MKTIKLLTCQNLTIAYDGHIAAENISFTLERGDYLCVVGENGSGKSTLLKALVGLVKPARGSFVFSGISPSDIGYLPQQTAAQKDFPSDVFEVVLSGRLAKRGNFPFYSKADKAAALEKIRKLEIEELAKKSYRDLSSGQQQRVLLARALCAEGKLLLLDEPAAGLDPVMTANLYRLIHQLNIENGISIIMVSHDIKSAVEFGNKILHLKTRPLYCGSREEYIKTEVYRGIRV